MHHKLIAAALAALAATPALAVPASGDPVRFWNEVMLGASFNPGQTRPAALLNVAMHGAVNATSGKPDYTYVTGVPNMGGDTRAAASRAAHDILVSQYPARAAEFAAKLAESLALVPDGDAKTRGIATGAAFAAATLAKRADDGTFDVVPYAPSGLPGRWAPTPPGFVNPPVTPQQRYVDSFLTLGPDQFRAAPPPAIDSAEYAAAFNEAKAIGAAGSATRTADQTASAQYWAAATGPGPWLRMAIDQGEAAGLTTLESARLFARLAATIQDTGVAVWDSKYEYDYWRPVTGIRAADTDGNPDTLPDLTWTPLITTPPHPTWASLPPSSVSPGLRGADAAGRTPSDRHVQGPGRQAALGPSTSAKVTGKPQPVCQLPGIWRGGAACVRFAPNGLFGEGPGCVFPVGCRASSRSRL